MARKPKQQKLFHQHLDRSAPRCGFSAQHLCWTLKPEKSAAAVPVTYGEHLKKYKGAQKEVVKRVLKILHSSGPENRTFKWEIVKFMGSEMIVWDLTAISRNPLGTHYPLIDETLSKVDKFLEDIKGLLEVAGYKYPEWLFILRTYNRTKSNKKDPFLGLDFITRE